MDSERTVAFELDLDGFANLIRVWITDRGERNVAEVQCGNSCTTGLGVSAREALVAALTPFGARTSTAVMAAPAMFGASAQLLAAREAL